MFNVRIYGSKKWRKRERQEEGKIFFYWKWLSSKKGQISTFLDPINDNWEEEYKEGFLVHKKWRKKRVNSQFYII